jgi:hypothetical protein
MKKLLPIISFVGLALVIIPACLYLAGSTDKSQLKNLMLVGTVLWFVSAPLWMGRKNT